MQVRNKLPSILRDNDAAYLEYVENAVRSIDELASISVLQGLTAICFHIEASHYMLKQPIIKAVLKAHTLIGIQIVLASTINTSPYINFQLPIEIDR